MTYKHTCRSVKSVTVVGRKPYKKENNKYKYAFLVVAVGEEIKKTTTCRNARLHVVLEIVSNSERNTAIVFRKITGRKITHPVTRRRKKYSVYVHGLSSPPVFFLSLSVSHKVIALLLLFPRQD